MHAFSSQHPAARCSALRRLGPLPLEDVQFNTAGLAAGNNGIPRLSQRGLAGEAGVYQLLGARNDRQAIPRISTDTMRSVALRCALAACLTALAARRAPRRRRPTGSGEQCAAKPL